jgi:transposase
MEETITITRKEYDFLRSTIASLQEQIALLKNGKNSKTSHSAPSTDIGRSNSQNLRPVTDRKVGGQLGHAGSTLKMVLRPDKQQQHQVSHCNNCGRDLLGADGIEIEKRQEIVIAPIMAQSVEHITYQKTCPCCLHITQSVFAAHLKSSIQYGSSVASMVAYLSSYQYLPMQRIANLMQCAFGINMSVGTVKNMLSQMAAKALPTYNIIQQTLQASTVVGSDETGSKIAGKKGWFLLGKIQRPLLL